MANATTALLLEIQGYQMHRWSPDGVMWHGRCEDRDGRCICEYSDINRHVVNDHLTEAAFKDWAGR